jgi:hypothetical protein
VVQVPDFVGQTDQLVCELVQIFDRTFLGRRSVEGLSDEPPRRGTAPPAIQAHLRGDGSWERHGREKLDFMDPVLIYESAERWLEKSERRHLTAPASVWAFGGATS